MAYISSKNILKNGDTTYYIYNVARIPGDKTKRTQTIVEKFSASALIAEGKDPEEYVLSRLEKYRNEKKSQTQSIGYTVDLTADLKLGEKGGDLKVSDDNKNLGFLVYSKLFHSLEIDEFINNRRRYVDCNYNINTIAQHLVYSRLLWPASKKNTWEHRNRFFGDTDYELQSVYRSLDNLLKWREPLLRHLDSKIKEKYGRKNTVVFYDVTNYYFELDNADDEDGLRAKGVSKEHRPEPIIQMGLFMDELGLPITYELFRGNTSDSITLSDAMDTSIIDFSSTRKIIVADKGMLSYYNILKIRNDKNGYVISRSIRKSDKETVKYALSDSEWTDTVDANGVVTYRVKERIIPRKASTYGDIDNKKHTGTYNERQIFIWSKKYADRAKNERAEAIMKAMEAVGKKSGDCKDTNYGKAKYLIKAAIVKGEAIKADNFIYEFDEEKLAEDEKLDGYYIICTNVVGPVDDKVIENKAPDYAYYNKDGFLVLNHKVPASEIIDIYGGLWKIEETFKVTKTGMLNLRPIFHSKQDRIRAYFLISFLSLLLERLLEFQLGWKYSASSIQEALSSFNAVQLYNSNIYQVSYYDQIVDDILKTLDIGISKKFLLQNDIRKLIGETKKKDYE